MYLFFRCDNEMINRAARIAASDIRANFMPYQAGLLEKEKVCLMAGLDYDTPWTRDTAINTWFALAVSDPDIARNTLMSVCEKLPGDNLTTGDTSQEASRTPASQAGSDETSSDKMDAQPPSVHIAGQYWDKIIWILGARRYLSINKDPQFLQLAADAAVNTLREMEEQEFDPKDGLFRGPAVYGDGVAAYPDRYAKTYGNSSCILDWPAANPDKRVKCGYGIPMKTLSTNVIYCEAYRSAAWILRQLPEFKTAAGHAFDCAKTSDRQSCMRLQVLIQEYECKADRLKKQINLHFWNEQTGRYDYLFDEEGRCESTEALGLAFSILYGIADRDQIDQIVRNTLVLPDGIPVVWPSFGRYQIRQTLADGSEFLHYGRHSGTIWPHAQAYWGLAMKQAGYEQAFFHELSAMAGKAVRDMQFAEIYHPETGEIYGGLQEPGAKEGERFQLYKSCEKQTWSATGFWALLLYGIFGISYEEGQIRLDPCLSEQMQTARLDGVPAGGRCVSIVLERIRQTGGTAVEGIAAARPADGAAAARPAEGIIDAKPTAETATSADTQLLIPLGEDGELEYRFYI